MSRLKIALSVLIAIVTVSSGARAQSIGTVYRETYPREQARPGNNQANAIPVTGNYATYKNTFGDTLRIKGKVVVFSGKWNRVDLVDKPWDVRWKTDDIFIYGPHECRLSSKQIVCDGDFIVGPIKGIFQSVPNIQLDSSSKASAESKTRSAEAAKQAAEERAQREKAEQEEQRRIIAEREAKKTAELQEQARLAAESKTRSAEAAKLRLEIEEQKKSQTALLEAANQAKIAAEEERRARADAVAEKARADAATRELAEKAKLVAAQEKKIKEAEEREAKLAKERVEVEEQKKAQTVISSLPAQAALDRDPLSVLDGGWVSISPPGPQVFFNKTGLGSRSVGLPILGQASIRVSGGEYGSNFRVSGAGFNCFYNVAFTKKAERMVWELKGGDSICMPSSAYERIE